MRNFITVLDCWAIKGTAFEARFTQGPTEAPVIYVNVENIENPGDVETYFRGIEPFNEEVVVSVTGSSEVTIKCEYSAPFQLQGSQVHVRTTPLEAADFERTARLSEEWGKSMQEAWSNINSRIGNAKHLLEDQRRRLVEKAERHDAKSTARILYNQQISFIDRVLSKLET